MSELAGHIPASTRVLLWSVVKAISAVGGLLLAYFMFPLNARDDVLLGAAAVTVGLVVFAVIFVRQLRQVRGAEYPLLRAVEAIALIATSFVVLMASIHFICGQVDAANYSEALSRLDALYFTVTTLATVGFGDITPTSAVTRSITTGQMVLGLALVGAGVRVVMMVAQRTVEGRKRESH
jgi:voltage-gated potassium channel